MLRTLRLIAACLACLVLFAVGASAGEPAERSRLSVTVVDQTGGVIPNASVSASLQGEGSPPVTTQSNGVGVAVMDGLAEGRYTIHVEFPGFEPLDLREVRVRGRETRLRATLQIRRLDEAVTVARDGRTKSLDPRGSAFSSVLTREQIDALPDDPDEMEAALKSLAPAGAVIRVDGFSGGKLPRKSQIRSIRLPRLDMFAAQNHGGGMGMTFIDIMTMPGNGPLGGSVDFNFLDDAFNARNPFTRVKGAEQLRQFGYSLSGTIKPNRTSFSLSGGGISQYSSPNLRAVLPGLRTLSDSVRQPTSGFDLSARLDHALTKDHALRASYDRTSSSARTLGVGGYDLADRAYDVDTTSNTLRFSENGPVGRRMFGESRLQIRWGDTSSRAINELPTIQVRDAFTSGGAQRRGGQRSTEFEAASDLDYVRGAHSWRTGMLLEGGWYRTNEMSNYLGTYTFASLADYTAGRPSNYTRRIGDPDVRFSALQAAAYIQDDWRITRSLLFSPGVRYGSEGHVDGKWNLSPRASLAWSPFRRGTLTLRGSYGYFYDWIAIDTYKQSLLVDGERQREVNLQDPSYPEAPSDAATPPTNRYLWASDASLPKVHRVSLGVERTVGTNSRLTASYSRGWGRGLLRGRNLNAPVDGARPEASDANVILPVGDAASRFQRFSAAYSYTRPNWHRLFVIFNYGWSRATTNTAGAYQVPATGDALNREWGPSSEDMTHRIGAAFNVSPTRNLALGLNLHAQSGLPGDITTGRDDNGDGIFNDRPAGTPRNAARGAMQWDLGGRISYAIGFGPARSEGGGQRVTIRTGGGGLGPAFGGGAEDKRFGVEFYLTGQNLLNRSNYTAYSFVLTSPFYGQPVAAAQPRKLQAGVRFSF